MTLLVVGSIALDSIFTPFGETADALGGSAVYFSVAASLLHPLQVVGVVGVAPLARRGIAVDGVRPTGIAVEDEGHGSPPSVGGSVTPRARAA